MPERDLRPLLTDEFLATLLECYRAGCGSDYVEIAAFIDDCYARAGKPAPDWSRERWGEAPT